MFRTLKKSIVLILIILILPTAIFSLYEIGTLRDNEQVIESIYNNQLDAILYSVNQYSEDVLNDWASSIIMFLNKNGENAPGQIDEFFAQIPAENCLFVYNNETQYLQSTGYECKELNLSESIRKLILDQDSTLKKILTYLQGGYRKIETFVLPDSDRQVMIFAHEQGNSNEFIALVLDPNRFINEVLDPKIQEIAREKFNIAISKSGSDQFIYTSDRQNIPASISHKRPLWLLKNYDIGIELIDRTITDLAKERTRTNLIVIGIIDIVLLLSIWLIFRNIHRQMELAKLKSDFVSSVSHEIRTPLALIQMYIESLEMDRVKSQEKVKEYYNVILQETQRLTGIVNKILNFSQIESGKRRYSMGEVHLNEIVDTVIKSFSLVLEKNGFETVLNLSDNLPAIWADRESIADILVNLVDNAMKYSDSKKYIEIQTQSMDSKVILKVIDKGIGITLNDQKNIFDKFYRVTEKNLALKAKGSGLGLTIVKHIIDAHKGKIEVKSEKGAGTEFIIILPIKQTEKL